MVGREQEAAGGDLGVRGGTWVRLPAAMMDGAGHRAGMEVPAAEAQTACVPGPCH